MVGSDEEGQRIKERLLAKWREDMQRELEQFLENGAEHVEAMGGSEQLQQQLQDLLDETEDHIRTELFEPN